MRADAFLRALGRGKPCLLLLDFDGTLAPIRRDRRRVRLGADWWRLLVRLVDAPGVRVALISGRDLADLRLRVPIPGLFMVGNHGLDWSNPAWGPSPTKRKDWQERVRLAGPPLRSILARYAGVDLEDKGLGLCLHLRGLAPALRPALGRELGAFAAGLGLEVRRGRASLEVGQAGPWDKGKAVRQMRQAFRRGAPCFFAGDDLTDERGFKALAGKPRCLSFKVGRGPSAADLQGSRAALGRLLCRILEAQIR